MYNRDILINKAREIKARFNANFVILVHSSAEVLHGIKELTNDLDISGDFKGFENIEPSKCEPPHDLWFLEDDDVDICIVDDITNNVIPVDGEDGIYYSTIQQLLLDKESLGRDKDKKAIIRINEFLKNM